MAVESCKLYCNIKISNFSCENNDSAQSLLIVCFMKTNETYQANAARA
jgi:hypothetical protein